MKPLMSDIWEISWERKEQEGKRKLSRCREQVAFLSGVQRMSLWSTLSHINCHCNIQKMKDGKYQLGSREWGNYKAMKVPMERIFKFLHICIGISLKEFRSCDSITKVVFKKKKKNESKKEVSRRELWIWILRAEGVVFRIAENPWRIFCNPEK